MRSIVKAQVVKLSIESDMIQQYQPNSWSCLPTAFAMALECPVDFLISCLGHDGSRIIPQFVELSGQMCRQSFHIQEIIRVATRMGWAVTPIEPAPTSEAGGKIIPLTEFVPFISDNFIAQWMIGEIGVVTGQVSRTGMRHAVAWHGTGILDPSGVLKSIDEFAIETFWKVQLIKSS